MNKANLKTPLGDGFRHWPVISIILVSLVCADVVSAQPYGRFTLTQGSYDCQSSMDSIVVNEFGPEARVADWVTITSLFSGDIESFCDSVGLTGYQSNAWCYSNGQAWWDGWRHYFVERHDHIFPPPETPYWLAHASIDNHFLDLGSWCGFSTPILVDLGVTAPVVSTLPSDGVTDTSATLNGSITDDGGEGCQYRFRYKKTGGSYKYTSWTGSATTGQSFSESVSGLDSGSTYYFNAQAKNSAGESDWGNEQSFVTSTPPVIPVILVYGWRGNPTVWDVLRSKLDAAGIDYYVFDYSPATGDPRFYAEYLDCFVEMLRQITGYTGKFDIVCHSMGAPVSRLYTEEMGGDENIRQWIGLAPVNNGAAIADWWLAHLKYPDSAVDQMAIKSPMLARLNYDVSQFDIEKWGTPQKLSPNVIYRNMIGISDPGNHNVAEKTLVVKKDNKGELYHYWTFLGDGVVAMEQSILKGPNVANEVFPGRTHSGTRQKPDSAIYRDPIVIEKIINYLINPSLPLINDYPQTDTSDDHSVSSSDNKGYIFRNEDKEMKFLVDSSTQKALVMANWDGSDINLTLTSPRGVVIEPNVTTGVEYGKTDTRVCYELNRPEIGEWTARIEAVDVPEEGELFDFMTFYSSSLALYVRTGGNRTYYNQGDQVRIVARCTDGNIVITGSTLTAKVLSPSFVTGDLILYDDGTQGDITANDGYYTCSYFLLEEGTYEITVAAQGTSNSTAFERTIPMVFWVTSKGDLNYDDKVDFYDFAFLAEQWMQTQCRDPNWCGGADLDHSGDLGPTDIMIIAQNWLKGSIMVMPIKADLNFNGTVNLNDFSLFATQWHQTGCQDAYDCHGADLAPEVRDGIVDELDLAVLAEHWLEGTTP